ncbi:hypothetical protein BYT27DRAFT_7084181, partial [Phlegmacium glaucopus]
MVKGYVHCVCCNQVIPRKREREHRRQAAKPYATTSAESGPLRRRSAYLAALFKSLSDSDGEDKDNSNPPPGPPSLPASPQSPPGQFSVSEDNNMAIDTTEDDGDVDEVLLSRWRKPVKHQWASVLSESEDELENTENEGTSGAEMVDDDDDDRVDVVDWDALERECGLSAWDRLGEAYEADAAQIAEKLDEYDRAICRAFSYKVTTHTTDAAYKKIPLAFQTDPPLPTLHTLRSRATFLSGFKPELYHCCPNSCCCYVGPHADLKICPFCKEDRYRADGRTPRKIFTYIPLIPRLKAFALNSKVATTMQYRADYTSQHGIIADVFDGSHYATLRNLRVKLNHKQLDHTYFSDRRDVALGLSTDGFAPFNKRKSTAW